MLEKLDSFANKFLKWKVVKYLLLSDLFMIPYTFYVQFYNIPALFNIIMVLSLCFSFNCLNKAFRNIAE